MEGVLYIHIILICYRCYIYNLQYSYVDIVDPLYIIYYFVYISAFSRTIFKLKSILN